MRIEHVAYVVIKIEFVVGLPTVTGIGIYSEGWRSLTIQHKPRVAYAEVLTARAESYARARALAIEQLRSYPGSEWMADWVEKGGREVSD